VGLALEGVEDGERGERREEE